MFIQKTEGPRTVRLPDGSMMSRADLPPVNCARWVASRKLAVVKAVVGGLMTREQVCARYELSDEELTSWMTRFRDHGSGALKVTAAGRYRTEPVGQVGQPAGR